MKRSGNRHGPDLTVGWPDRRRPGGEPGGRVLARVGLGAVFGIGLIATGVFYPALSDAFSLSDQDDASTGDHSAQRAATVLGEDADGGARYAAERARFVDARDALAQGQRARFIELESSLRDYPLHDYLIYERLRTRWGEETPAGIDIRVLDAFAEASGDSTLTNRLAYRLQSRFAATAQWTNYLALAESPRGRRMPCRTLQARAELGRLRDFDEAALEQWGASEEPEKPCQAPLAALEARSAPPLNAIWNRIFGALEADQPSRAESVLHYLGKRDREPVQRWIAARKQPATFLASGALGRDTLINRHALADLVRVWSKDDVVSAMEYWRAVNADYGFSDERRYEVTRALAMRAAYRRLPEAQAWLAEFDSREDDLEFAEWRVRTALLAADWRAVLATLQRLPEEEQAEDHWRYWEARAYQAEGRDEEARAIFAELAKLQSWHGFLSAGQIGEAYAIENIPIEATETRLRELASDASLQRAREYYAVELAHEGRREWNAWLEGRQADDQAVAAVLAKLWGLDDRAIFSAGRAERREALSIRFPILYRDLVDAEASANDLEPALVFGVMRRESAYIADIKSGAGAIGLMQLMPATAKQVAGMRGLKKWHGDLTDPATNIAFGTHYLRYVRDRFDDHAVLATASYNAGPHRVQRWLPTDKPMEADRWIDTIPFSETRRYVRAVFAYAAIYQKELDGGVFELDDFLLPVPAAAEES